jgi:hypothetical protein
MQSGKSDRESINAITNIMRITFNAQVESQRELNILRVIHDDVGDVSDLRVDRLTHTHSHVPTLVWLVLITGSIISVIYSYFFFVILQDTST